MHFSPVKPILPLKLLLSNSISNRHAQHNTHGFKQFALLTCLCALLYAYWQLFPAALAFGITSLIALVSSQVLYYKQSALGSKSLLCFQAYAVCICIITLTGGIMSPLLTVLLHIPLLAYLIQGKRNGIAWLGIVACSIIMLYMLQAAQIDLPALHLKIPYFTFLVGNLGVLFLFFLLVLAQLIYTRVKQFVDVQLQNKQLEHTLFETISTKEQLEHAFSQQAEGLKKTNEELDRFIYNSSHNLRGPLARIQGLLNLCKMPNKHAELVTYLELMEKCAENLDSAISSTVQFAENKNQALKQEDTYLHDLVSNVFEQNCSSLKAEDIVFLNEIPEDMVIKGDPDRFENIFNILISNAIQFRKGTHDCIRTHAHLNDKGRLVLKIEDNGTGIKPEVRPFIFDMFYRGHKSAKGSGLGLYNLKQILGKLNGQIEVQSKPEVGTTVHISMPLGQAKRKQNSKPTLVHA